MIKVIFFDGTVITRLSQLPMIIEQMGQRNEGGL
jgi:hypothetical protein